MNQIQHKLTEAEARLAICRKRYRAADARIAHHLHLYDQRLEILRAKNSAWNLATAMSAKDEFSHAKMRAIYHEKAVRAQRAKVNDLKSQLEALSAALRPPPRRRSDPVEERPLPRRRKSGFSACTLM